MSGPWLNKVLGFKDGLAYRREDPLLDVKLDFVIQLADALAWGRDLIDPGRTGWAFDGPQQ